MLSRWRPTAMTSMGCHASLLLFCRILMEARLINELVVEGTRKDTGVGGISPSFFLDSPRSVVTACGFFKGKSRWSLPTVLLELLPFSLSFFFLLFFFWINYKLPGPPFPHVRYRFFFDKFSNFENLFRPRKSCCEKDRMDRSWIRELKVLYFSNKAKQRI